ncbi:putative membrane protein [Peptoclostridium acidaminophilum DSM 3953]|uniref:Putative membrane protein n=1 Tax=Peptoclostridium acidaminophilum DSM 3953 TaxID=1286171 RepID=W8T579_PEPAC|nr:DUF881 domain-containing protein [Peptoclostridium acidaminophilum]AHM56914.1 putative membrane protein [Peptoclostridium acidaminophilum DSM 3953]
MKNKINLMVLMIVLLGILMGIQFKAGYNERFESSFIDREITAQVNQIRKENTQLSDTIRAAKHRVSLYENSAQEESPEIKKLKKEVEDMKLTLGYVEALGSGLIIKIDTNRDENLGFIMEEKKWFLLLINDIRYYGGEAISINGQRISPYTEIVLAGNHININSVPIVQPYEISVLGDIDRLGRYINDDNILIESMRKAYDMDISIKKSGNMSIPKLEDEKKLKYVRR